MSSVRLLRQTLALLPRALADSLLGTAAKLATAPNNDMLAATALLTLDAAVCDPETADAAGDALDAPDEDAPAPAAAAAAGGAASRKGPSGYKGGKGSKFGDTASDAGTLMSVAAGAVMGSNASDDAVANALSVCVLRLFIHV